MPTICNQDFIKLAQLPSLKKDWVRLVHRCIMENGQNLANIKQHGLIFNRNAAHLPENYKGGSYQYPSAMVSIYNEDSFWRSLQHDDFAIFDNARYADTKLVFDIPKEELCFLQAYGKKIHGRIDAKYLVGIIPNINGANPSLRMHQEMIAEAERTSRHSNPADIKPNNLQNMIEDLLDMVDQERREQAKQVVDKRLKRELEMLNDILENKKKPISNFNIPKKLAER